MYQLPNATAINKPLYKKTVFDKFNLKTAERNRFDTDISRMTLVARVSAATLPALAEGSDIKGFYVMQVVLKRKEYDEQNIMLLQKLIPQKIVFALQYGELTQLCVFHTRLLRSVWLADNDTVVALRGLTLDDVWQNIVVDIGGLDAESTDNIETQILNREHQAKIQRQIDILEKQCRSEIQTHKKYELHQKILELKQRLNNLINLKTIDVD